MDKKGNLFLLVASIALLIFSFYIEVKVLVKLALVISILVFLFSYLRNGRVKN